METLVVFLLIVMVAGGAVLYSRLRELEQRLERESQARRELTARIHKLEIAGQRPAQTPAPQPVLVEEPVFQKPAPPEPEPAPPPPVSPALCLCQFCGRKVAAENAVCACGAVLDPKRIPPPLPQPPPLPEPPPVIAAPEPVLTPGPALAVNRETFREWLKKKIGGREWEAIVGGSWLNKLGVLVLVIAIVSLLQYEFGRIGPAGRVAMGFGIALAMLISGVMIERREGFAIFARGLIGGGWAALYFTAYAMHAVAAARVIDNPIAASALLLTVASGMIAHSLYYRSQTVSGLAYFIAFATLAMSENTPMAVVAVIPLAASMLALAYRFDWYRMAVFGLFATYSTCASRADTGASLASTQSLFAIYWLLFEAFDLLRLRRRPRGFSPESLILPLNAIGFIGLSAVKWHRAMPERAYLFLAVAAALYLVSAILRAWLSPPEFESPSLERIAAGSYEGPITISAALAGLAIFERASGLWINLGWLIEGEILFLAGIRSGQLYLRQLAAVIFVAPLAKLLGADNPAQSSWRKWMHWTHVSAITAATFYVNRTLCSRHPSAPRPSGSGGAAEPLLYSWPAAGLIALILADIVPGQYVTVAWLAFAVLLHEIALRKSTNEFRYQSYVIGVLGTAACFFVNLPAGHAKWLPVAIAAAIHYATTLRLRHEKSQGASWFSAASALTLCSAMIWKYAPGDYRGVSWLALGALLYELGFRGLPRHFRRLSYLVSSLGALHVLYFHVLYVHKGSGRAGWISLLVSALICIAAAARVFRTEDREKSAVRDANAGLAAVFAMSLAWLVLPAPVVALAWAAASLILFELALPRLRAMANLAGAATFARLFMANFTEFGNTLHISHRLLTVGPVIVSHYYIWRRYRERAYLYAPAILAVVLMRFELGRSLAVIAWALLGLILYRFGLKLQIQDLRWQSYAIAVLAFWRCWSTNFYIPESLLGIEGRVLAGASVIVCFYFAQLLSPRQSRSRTFYLLLSSVLLAALLFYEASGGILTVAWGIEGLALLIAGFPLRDRMQRLAGLVLFLVCVLKLFLYDLRELETVNRIISFIVLGVILVGVSWMYTRFRDRIQRYL